jgi:signal transduction histidine kinase
MHRLLKRQLRKHLSNLEIDSLSTECRDFIDAIDKAYQQFDDDRLMLERSLELSSQELIQANSEMAAVFQALPDLFFRLDFHGNILDCKAGSEVHLPDRREKMIGKQLRDIPIQPVGAGFQEAINQIAATRSQVNIEYSVEGQHHIDFYEARLLPLLNNQVIAVIRNITERIQSENERAKLETQVRHMQKMETIGTLAAGIAHDFNNILLAIQGYIDMCLDEIPLGSQVHKDLEEVKIATNRGKEIVQQILTFSRPDVEERGPLKLHFIVREVLTLLKASMPSNITINQNLNRNCDPVMANSGHIYQVVMNLCTNAFHAMDKAGGVLSLSLNMVTTDDTFLKDHPKLLEKKYVQLTVNDTGEGMDHKTLDRVFDPFFSTKEVGKGTGLGLSVVHGIVTTYNGDITIESRPARGTTFRVYLPVVEDAPDRS